MVGNNKKKSNEEDQIELVYQQILPFLTSEALDRLTNIKSVHPELYKKALLVIYQNIVQGRINKVDEKTLKYILEKLSEDEKREPKIRFIHK